MEPEKQREGFGSRLGFILVSAGCAIGIGNVWRFPTVTGQYGGGIFVLFYLLFLVLMGLPVLTMELAVGRAGRGAARSAVHASTGSDREIQSVLPSSDTLGTAISFIEQTRPPAAERSTNHRSKRTQE